MSDHRPGRAAARCLGLLAVMAAIAIASSAGAQAQGKWRSAKPIPQGANEVIGGQIDGKVLVYGGQDPQSRPQGIFWTYDPATDAWSQLPSNPAPVHHAAAVSIGRKFYVIGGFHLPKSGKSGWYPTDKAWVFDLDSRQWSELPPMPTARGALAAAAVGTRIYVNGGARIPTGTELPDGLTGGGPVELLATTEVFDTATNTWSAVAPMLTPRNHHNIAYVDGKIYAIGGRVVPASRAAGRRTCG